jgi:hypothetical protein
MNIDLVFALQEVLAARMFASVKERRKKRATGS